jgi:hypothetical protein
MLYLDVKLIGDKMRKNYPAGHSLSALTADGKERPEYSVVLTHQMMICRSTAHRHRYYKGVPFYDGWRAENGGSPAKGMHWILKNLGPKPEGAHLHMVPLSQGGKGFGPWRAADGGWSVRWVAPVENQQVENKNYVSWPSNEQFEAEMIRRGYSVVKGRE